MSRLERIGPVLAIGRPGEKLAQLGAARLYVTQDDWQTIARRLMASARIVVIRVGKTPGIRWELARALRELPPEKIILWFPSMFRGSAYAVLRDVVREVLKVKLPETRPKSLMTFDASWRLRPTKLETLSMDAGRAVGQSPTADSRLAAVAPSLSDLLEQLELDITSPPPFRLHPATWIAVVVWLVLLWVVPGKRWSFSLVEILSLPHFFGPLVEGATTMLLAIGLPFILYIRDPTRRLRPSLVLCAVLALDSYWIIAREEGFGLHACTTC